MRFLIALAFLAILLAPAVASAQIIRTTSFTNCNPNQQACVPLCPPNDPGGCGIYNRK